MKKIIFTLCAALLLATAAQAAEHRREISREFQTGSEPQLKIDNRFGNIRIIEGQENRILFKIEITAKARSESRAKELAESVSVDFSQEVDRVSAETRIGSMDCRNNCRRTVHYTVVAPRNAVMHLINQFGNISLGDAVKPLDIDLKFGDLDAGTLARATVSLEYGKATVQAATQLKIRCRFSKLDLGTAEQLEIDSEYDGIRVKSAADFTLKTGFTNVTVGRIRDRFAVDGKFQYGNLEIEEIDPGFSQIKINAAFSKVKVALTRDHHFRANLSTHFGHIRAGETTFNEVTLQNDNAITGTANTTGSPRATVDISNSFGDIIFK